MMTHSPVLASLTHEDVTYQLTYKPMDAKILKLPGRGETFQLFRLIVMADGKLIRAYSEVPMFNQSLTLKGADWDALLVRCLLEERQGKLLSVGLKSVTIAQMPAILTSGKVQKTTPVRMDEMLHQLADAMSKKPNINYYLAAESSHPTGLVRTKIAAFQPTPVNAFFSTDELMTLADLAKSWFELEKDNFLLDIELEREVTFEMFSQLSSLMISDYFQEAGPFSLKPEPELEDETVISSLSPLDQETLELIKRLPVWVKGWYGHLLRGCPFEFAIYEAVRCFSNRNE